MPRLQVEAIAETEIADAFEWYRTRSGTVARVFLNALDATLTQVGQLPERFPVVHKDIRRAMVPRFPYCVFFVAETEVIRVIGVVHGKRHPRRWQSGA